MRIAEDLLLLLMNRQSGELPKRKSTHIALAAAVLIEAATDKVREPDDLINATVPRLYRRLLDQLTEQGVLTQTTRWWSVTSRTVWRPTDPARRNEVITELTTVLFGRTAPDQRTGALITLVTALGVLDDLLDGHSEEATRRAEEISAGDWPADEMTKAIIAASRERVEPGLP